jgi:hypothetical protein
VRDVRWPLSLLCSKQQAVVSGSGRSEAVGENPENVNVESSAPVHANAMPLVRTVHSAVPGRARFAVAGLYQDAALARVLEGQLRRRSGILSASASPLILRSTVR